SSCRTGRPVHWPAGASLCRSTRTGQRLTGIRRSRQRAIRSHCVRVEPRTARAHRMVRTRTIHRIRSPSVPCIHYAPAAPVGSTGDRPALAVAPALSVSHIHHRFGDRVALNDVSFDVGMGEFFALLGPNGGGKTTLFRIVSTLIDATGGTVQVFGIDVRRPPGGA